MSQPKVNLLELSGRAERARARDDTAICNRSDSHSPAIPRQGEGTGESAAGASKAKPRTGGV